MLSVILIIIGFILLVKCADFFVDGCCNVAKSFGIPSLLIGLTIVSFGTSAPEAAVSIIASLNGENTIALGNVVGSNICNLLLVLGCSSLFASLVAKKKIITRDFVYSLFSSIILFILTAGFFILGNKEGIITRTNGFILLCFLTIYMYALIGEAIRSIREKEEKTKFDYKDIFRILFGIAGIILGGELVVNNAVNIANMLNISSNVVALSIVAIGTSLPELVTSVVASKKGEVDIAIGNVVGSNIFNIFFILGITSAISPVVFGFESFIDIIVMLICSLFTYFILLVNNKINRKSGIVLLIMYFSYMAYILIR